MDQQNPHGSTFISAAENRARRLLRPRRLAVRSAFVMLSKLVLPLVALFLLTSIALWPEFRNAASHARLAIANLSGRVEGGHMVDVRYHGVDDRGRPYTVTAVTAQQETSDRVDMTSPKGDIVLENGTWVMLQSKLGTYIRSSNQLDLSRDVVLYRDDGTTLTTANASIDIKNGAAASSDPVHAEGPFGTLDAQGFMLLDKGASIQFAGPAHLELSGATP